ncbi:MAG: response regulator [Deltaproteobacteria bacterium]
MEKFKKKILVVDDDEMLLMATKELLTAEGYDVATHVSGFGVINRITTSRPDIVLLDINMPALSGDNLAKLVLQRCDVPIVFHSSNDEDSLRRAVAECRVKGYICKGDIFDLKRKVATYLL